MSRFYKVMGVMMVLAIPSLALAGPYIGLGMGIGRMSSTLSELGLEPNPILDVDRSVFDGDTGFSSNMANYEFSAGWTFNKYFAVDVGYTKFGDADEYYELPETPDCPDPGCQQSRTWSTTVQMTGVHAFLVGSVPVTESLDVYAKLGAITWDANYDGYDRANQIIPTDTDPPVIFDRNQAVSFNDSGTDLAVGLGLNLKTDSPVSVHIDFSYYDVDRTDYVYDFSLMAIYNF